MQIDIYGMHGIGWYVKCMHKGLNSEFEMNLCAYFIRMCGIVWYSMVHKEQAHIPNLWYSTVWYSMVHKEHKGEFEMVLGAHPIGMVWYSMVCIRSLKASLR